MVCVAGSHIATSDVSPAQPVGTAVPKPGIISDVSASRASRAIQGSSLRVWFSNEMTFGRTTFDATPPWNIAYGPGAILGMSDDRNDSIEHLFGAGPWIGGIINGAPRVLSAYSSEGSKDFPVDPQHPSKNRIYSSFSWYEPERTNRRDCDDDGDGLIDEDPLDGRDNDGDWDPARDDVGADGIPDIDEFGCRGVFNAATNPDPAFDNYSPVDGDSCRPDSAGSYPPRSDPYLYTEKNTMPDSGEPNVDEDYGRVSDLDQTCIGRSRYPSGRTLPLAVEILQVNYTWPDYPWGDGWSSGSTPVEFRFVNVGDSTAHDVYLGFFADMDVGYIGRGGYFYSNYSCYIESLRTAYTHNPADRSATPAGVTVLGASGNLDSLKAFFHWWIFAGPPWNEAMNYTVMSGETGAPTMTECQPLSEMGDTRFLLSVGPYDEFKPGDTLGLTVAFVGGERVYGENSLVENAARAIVLYERDYHPPVTPSSPILMADQGDRSVHLRWDVRNGIDGPVTPWDLYSTTARGLPADHWRRMEPPCDEIDAVVPCPESSPCVTGGEIPGGRNFEGFRLYRSDAADPNNEYYPNFSLVREYDLDDEFGYNFGIDSEYTDVNLRPDARYWYSVTSFAIPEVVVRTRRARSGAYVVDTIRAEGSETPAGGASLIRFDLKFNASDEPGMVKVVPNPYRAYEDYTREAGGWEGDARNWTEFGRALKFIHLPRSCTIRICTVAGDIVKTLNYQAPSANPNQGELDWNLISDGGWSVASGLYVYVVESDMGRQFGKFVVIR